MSEPIKPLLAISDLHTRFHTLDGVVNAVDGVDMEVFPGETLGLVGESGCGKSVTALSILQLLRCPPAEIRGQIRFEGINLLDLGREGIRRIRGNSISMIFQEPMTSLNPVLTIGEQIAEAIVLHQRADRQEAWERAVEMLQMVQIPEPKARARDYPHKLSGGMRQRAMIAMALSCHPQLLLADEPTTALDVTIQAQITSLMGRLKEEFETSIVIITHNLGLIAEMARRVVVMYAGRVVEEAPVKELFKEPLHPYTESSGPVEDNSRRSRGSCPAPWRCLRDVPSIPAAPG
jgi:peptide/nickel transport system ATP-binding protein